jgi:hypothetical protein
MGIVEIPVTAGISTIPQQPCHPIAIGSREGGNLPGTIEYKFKKDSANWLSPLLIACKAVQTFP